MFSVNPYQLVKTRLKEAFHPLSELDNRLLAIMNEMGGTVSAILLVTLAGTYSKRYGKKPSQEIVEAFSLQNACPGLLRCYLEQHPDFILQGEGNATQVLRREGQVAGELQFITPKKSLNSSTPKDISRETGDEIEKNEPCGGTQKENDLYRFAFVPTCRLKELSKMALPENWTVEKDEPNGVLSRYLKYTLQRAMAEGKVIIKQEYASFNTGLVNKDYKLICAFFELNKGDKDLLGDAVAHLQKWFLTGFYVTGDGGENKLGKRALAIIGKEAERVNWITPEVIFFDTKREIYPDWSHIVLERLERLPIEFVKRYVPTGSLLESLYSHIETLQKQKATHARIIDLTLESKISNADVNFSKYADEPLSRWNINRVYKEALEHNCRDLANAIDAYKNTELQIEEIYKKAKALLGSDEARTRQEIIVWLESAVRYLIDRIKWDYATAVPCYYPSREMFGFLLPLSLVREDLVDVVLVVSPSGDRSYQGQTILTPSMAYSNARILRRPDGSWIRKWGECNEMR